MCMHEPHVVCHTIIYTFTPLSIIQTKFHVPYVTLLSRSLLYIERGIVYILIHTLIFPIFPSSVLLSIESDNETNDFCYVFLFLFP